MSSVEEHKESKRSKEDKAKSGFDKGLKAEKIIGENTYNFISILILVFYQWLSSCGLRISAI